MAYFLNASQSYVRFVIDKIRPGNRSVKYCNFQAVDAEPRSMNQSIILNAEKEVR
jgi:hypothetical protein